MKENYNQGFNNMQYNPQMMNRNNKIGYQGNTKITITKITITKIIITKIIIFIIYLMIEEVFIIILKKYLIRKKTMKVMFVDKEFMHLIHLIIIV